MNLACPCTGSFIILIDIDDNKYDRSNEREIRSKTGDKDSNDGGNNKNENGGDDGYDKEEKQKKVRR